MRVNVGFMDVDHQHLCEVLDALLAGILSGRETEQMRKTIDDLVAYALQHFAREENRMRETGYPDMVAHVRQHRAFSEKVSEFGARSLVDDGKIVPDLVAFMAEWLVSHILRTDQALAAWLRQAQTD